MNRPSAPVPIAGQPAPEPAAATAPAAALAAPPADAVVLGDPTRAEGADAADLLVEQQAFEAELAHVGEQLVAALDGLYPPLSSMARAAVRAATPLRRGALVLAVAVNSGPHAPLAAELLRERRIRLAAALEMLAIALNIHATLLGENAGQADRSLDKSIVGSTILTGDFCFSRAAWLAAQTESPVVVDLFAQALKTVSEGLLRAQKISAGRDLDGDLSADEKRDLDDGSATGEAFVRDLELALASVHAAAHLAGLAPEDEAFALELAPRFAGTAAAASGATAQGADSVPDAQAEGRPPMGAMQPGQVLRWRVALAWLVAQGRES